MTTAKASGSKIAVKKLLCIQHQNWKNSKGMKPFKTTGSQPRLISITTIHGLRSIDPFKGQTWSATWSGSGTSLIARAAHSA